MKNSVAQSVVALISAVYIVSCAAVEERQTLPSGVPPFAVGYPEQMQAAKFGNAHAIREMLVATRRFDGEWLLLHGCNLVRIRKAQPLIFEAQLRRLSSKDARSLDGVMESAEGFMSQAGQH